MAMFLTHSAFKAEVVIGREMVSRGWRLFRIFENSVVALFKKEKHLPNTRHALLKLAVFLPFS